MSIPSPSCLGPSLRIAKHGLWEDEYKKIVQILGREAYLTELGRFSVMWSETIF
ncbi:MAG: hypothetical protein IH787_02230 [Nitrospirae bacterium]|nr:hypothetical protein [Nitrospirota bacterium]